MAGKETKKENGKDFPASDYAHIGDPEHPSTWKLRMTEEPGEAPTPAQVGRAAAALSPGGFRGRSVDLSPGDRAKAVARVRAAWRKANPDKKDAEMPMAIHMSADDPLTTEDFTGIELLETGPQTDMFGTEVNFTESDLDDIANTWQELGDSVESAPIRLGAHENGEIKTTDGVVAGWATNFRRDGNKLLYDMKKVPGQVAQLFRAGQFRKRSAGLLKNYEWNGKTYPWMVDHVALLGDRKPAIRNLKDMIALYSQQESADKGMTIITFEQEQQTQGQNDRRDEQMNEEIRKALNLSADASDEDVIQAVSAVTGKVQEQESELADVKAQFEQLQNESSGKVMLSRNDIVQLQADAKAGTEAKAELKEMKKETSFQMWQAEGKVLPSQVEIMKRAYDADPAQFEADMAQAPALVTPGAAGSNDTTPPGLAQAAAKRLEGVNNPSYDDVRKATLDAYHENPALAGASA